MSETQVMVMLPPDVAARFDGHRIANLIKFLEAHPQLLQFFLSILKQFGVPIPPLPPLPTPATVGGELTEAQRVEMGIMMTMLLQLLEQYGPMLLQQYGPQLMQALINWIINSIPSPTPVPPPVPVK